MLRTIMFKNVGVCALHLKRVISADVAITYQGASSISFSSCSPRSATVSLTNIAQSSTGHNVYRTPSLSASCWRHCRSVFQSLALVITEGPVCGQSFKLGLPSQFWLFSKEQRRWARVQEINGLRTSAQDINNAPKHAQT